MRGGFSGRISGRQRRGSSHPSTRQTYQKQDDYKDRVESGDNQEDKVYLLTDQDKLTSEAYVSEFTKAVLITWRMIKLIFKIMYNVIIRLT